MLNLGLSVRNSLSLTPQLQQAIRILQLSSLELEQEIQQQLEINPLLEEEDASTSVELVEEYHELVEVSEQFKQQDLPQELSVDAQWDDVFTHQANYQLNSLSEERLFENAEPMDIKQQLTQQVDLLHLSQEDLLIAYCILDGIDERGFLEISCDDIVQTVEQLLQQMGIFESIELEQVEAVLKRIQRLEPLGVASRSLVEFFQLQLQTIQSVEADNALKLLQYYDLFIQQNISKLLKNTGLNQEQLKQAIDLLKGLSKYPFASSEYERMEYQIPDVLVDLKDGQWWVKLNPDVMPKLGINAFYKNMLSEKQYQNSHAYLRQNLNDAKALIKNIDERHKTILRVAQCIVQYQQAFFLQGAAAMKPLVMREVAQQLDLHESTISRAINHKYMLTPKGLFEFKYFFSSQVPTADGLGHSATAIQAMIKQLIEQENPRKPLSDQALAELLQKEGIEVARRTVAKYRESLNIASSSQRKILI